MTSNTGTSPIYTLGDQSETAPDILIVDHQQGKEAEVDTQPPPDDENKEKTMEANQEYMSLQSRLVAKNAKATGTVNGIIL